MRPFNVDALEAVMHDKLAECFSKCATKNPKAAKLGAIPVCLITLASKPLFALASLIEATICFFLNLFGAIFSSKCRTDLGESMANFIFKLVSLPFCPFTALFQTIHRTVQIAQSPEAYKRNTSLLRGSVEALRNERAAPPRIVRNTEHEAVDSGEKEALLKRIPTKVWKDYDRWLVTQSNRSPQPIIDDIRNNVSLNTWNGIQDILNQRQAAHIKQVIKSGTGPFEQVD